MALLLMSIGCFALTKTKESMVTCHKIQVEDCNVFYREAGSPEKPAQRRDSFRAQRSLCLRELSHGDCPSDEGVSGQRN